MEINVINEYRVEIALSGEELADLGVSFERMDYADPRTRAALWRLQGELRKRGIFLRMTGKVLYEASKAGEGCLLTVSVLPPRGDDRPCVRQLVRSPRLPAAFRADGLPPLRRASALFGPEADISLLEYAGAYYMIVDGDCSAAALMQAEEFAERLAPEAEMLRAALLEHGGRTL